MPRLALRSVRLALALALAGCAAKSSNSGSTSAPPPAGPPASAPAAAAATSGAPIPPDSPLAKIKLGMSMQEVTNAIGAPTNQVKYSTGKAFIPFYFGDDTSRIEWSYKGLGRVVFSGGNVFGGGGGQVTRIDYDPKETGVRPAQ